MPTGSLHVLKDLGTVSRKLEGISNEVGIRSGNAVFGILLALVKNVAKAKPVTNFVDEITPVA